VAAALTLSLTLLLAVQMLRSEDPGVHYEAVGVIGNLVHSSQDIKQRVLEVGGWLGTAA
jgi:hypothetical protein